MSTLKVDGIRSNSASSDAITLANDGTCTAKISNRSNKNLIINGAMEVAQRGTSQSTSGTTVAYAVDRFFLSNPAGGQAQTGTQETNAPSGFYNSLKANCTTANTSLTTGSSDQFKIEYRIEGLDLASIQFGTSSAQTLTVSFWVKSNKTGNSALALLNYSNNRSFVHQYNIASADTWQKVSFTVTGDTSGSWEKNTNVGMRLRWGSFGTTYQTNSFDAWQAGQYMTTSNSPINFNSATNDYLQITGVQVERGNTATDFEHRGYGQELALCQRYCYVWESSVAYSNLGTGVQTDSSNVDLIITLPQVMRASPSFSSSGSFRTVGYDSGSQTAQGLSSFSMTRSHPHTPYLRGGISGGTGGAVGELGDNGSNNAKAIFSADL